MKKALILCSVASMIKQFNMENIKILKKNGYRVYALANFQDPGTIPIDEANILKDELKQMGVVIYDVNIKRNPFDFQNIQAFKKIKAVIEKENFTIIHCHSPIGGVLGRIAAIKVRKKGTKVIYTAHGFHFFKGSSLTNWAIYYPIEKSLSCITDVLITINKEDYHRAKTFYMKKVEYIPGIGIDTEEFVNKGIDIDLKKRQLNIPENSFVILSIGELNENKNHEIIIKALEKLDNKNIHYIICGIGELKGKIEMLVNELSVSDQVHLLDYREDIDEICEISDIFAFPSIREGLGVAALEAMSSGLPLLTSNSHGIKDFSINEVTGYSYDANDMNGFVEGITKMYNKQSNMNDIKKTNMNIAKKFDKSIVDSEMTRIYKEIETDN